LARAGAGLRSRPHRRFLLHGAVFLRAQLLAGLRLLPGLCLSLLPGLDLALLPGLSLGLRLRLVTRVQLGAILQPLLRTILRPHRSGVGCRRLLAGLRMQAIARPDHVAARSRAPVHRATALGPACQQEPGCREQGRCQCHRYRQLSCRHGSLSSLGPQDTAAFD
jgi:hypothetical protein